MEERRCRTEGRVAQRIATIMMTSMTDIIFLFWIIGEEGSATFDRKATLAKEKYAGLRSAIFPWTFRVVRLLQTDYPLEYHAAEGIFLELMQKTILDHQECKPGLGAFAQFQRSVISDDGRDAAAIPSTQASRHRRTPSDPALPSDLVSVCATGRGKAMTKELDRLMDVMSIQCESNLVEGASE
ncbi:hypothetical protein NMY22_g9109 [Coprinellus aureogranulatus]|nr:hypothetical protein NMY22_g9109 [Coprinellus aureogranulatus]